MNIPKSVSGYASRLSAAYKGLPPTVQTYAPEVAMAGAGAALIYQARAEGQMDAIYDARTQQLTTKRTPETFMQRARRLGQYALGVALIAIPVYLEIEKRKAIKIQSVEK